MFEVIASIMTRFNIRCTAPLLGILAWIHSTFPLRCGRMNLTDDLKRTETQMDTQTVLLSSYAAYQVILDDHFFSNTGKDIA